MMPCVYCSSTRHFLVPTWLTSNSFKSCARSRSNCLLVVSCCLNRFSSASISFLSVCLLRFSASFDFCFWDRAYCRYLCSISFVSLRNRSTSTLFYKYTGSSFFVGVLLRVSPLPFNLDPDSSLGFSSLRYFFTASSSLRMRLLTISYNGRGYMRDLLKLTLSSSCSMLISVMNLPILRSCFICLSLSSFLLGITAFLGVFFASSTYCRG